MARFRVYVKPFDDDGNYLADFIEVTKDVAALGDPSQSIDSGNFDVGVIKANGLSITLRNDHGLYSDVDSIKSIFRFTRKNSLIRITWDIRDYDLICGFFQCGREPLGGEEVIFEGVLNEVASISDIDNQQARFTILGYDSLLNEIEVPFDDLSNGDLLSEVVLAMLDQLPFNARVSVSASNISLGTDLAIDDVSSLENKTVGASLKNILLAANSVLYIKDNVVYVTAREESAALQYTFYGQASIRGNENIIDIPSYRDGLNRVFNLWTWTDTALAARDTTSLEDYGVRAKDISLPIISDSSTAKINTILAALRSEFSFPKVELELETPIWYTTLGLNILDKVNIDYPTIYTPADNNIMPRYGMSNYGAARYPYGQWSLTIDRDRSFKIMGKKINIKKQTITFQLREI